MTGQQVHVGFFGGGGGWEGRKHMKYLWYGSQSKSAWVIGLQLFLIALCLASEISQDTVQ